MEYLGGPIGAATARVARVRTLPTFENATWDPPNIVKQSINSLQLGPYHLFNPGGASRGASRPWPPLAITKSQMLVLPHLYMTCRIAVESGVATRYVSTVVGVSDDCFTLKLKIDTYLITHLHVYVVTCVCCHMYAVTCVYCHVSFHVCCHINVLTCVFSHVCCHVCAVMCVVTCICCHMCVLSHACVFICVI